MVLIRWADARLCSGMHTKKEALADTMEVFETLGFLLKKNKRETVIASEFTDKGNYRDIRLIPTGSIIAVKKLTFETGK